MLSLYYTYSNTISETFSPLKNKHDEKEKHK